MKKALSLCILLTYLPVCADEETFLDVVKSEDTARIKAYKGDREKEDFYDGETPLHFAAEHCSAKTVIAVIESGADPSARTRYGMTALMLLSRNPDADRAEAAARLIGLHVSVNALDSFGQSALAHAASYGRTDLVKALLAAHADPNTKDQDKKTPLMLACEHGDAGMVEALLGAGADADYGYSVYKDDALSGSCSFCCLAFVTGSWSWIYPTLVVQFRMIVHRYEETPLMIAARNGREDQPRTVHALIKAGAGVNDRGNDGDTALIYASGDKGRAETVAVLLDAKARVDLRTDNGFTALMQAGCSGDIRKISMLIAAGADVRAKADGGMTAIYGAASNGHGDAVIALAKAGADINALTGGKSSLTELIRTGEAKLTDAVRFLLQSGSDPDIPGEMGLTPLMWAAQKNRIDTAKALIAAKADVNARSVGEDQTALHIAVRNGKKEMTRLLIGAGADVNQPNGWGIRPLLYAKDRDIAALLEKAGAVR